MWGLKFPVFLVDSVNLREILIGIALSTQCIISFIVGAYSRSLIDTIAVLGSIDMPLAKRKVSAV